MKGLACVWISGGFAHDSGSSRIEASRQGSFWAAFFVCLLRSGSAAQALTISTAVSTTDPASISNGDSGSTNALSASGDQTVTEADGEIGTASGVYRAQSWADTYGGNENHTFNHTLTTVFTVATSPGLAYDVSFHTERMGTLGLDDDTFYNSTVYSSASLSVLTGTVNGVADALLNLSATELDDGSIGTSAVNQTSTHSDYTGQVGTQVFTVVTSWTSTVTSNYDESGVSVGQDVGNALFLNLEIPANPGDGVYTYITVTVVPEPSTALLVGLGMTGLASAHRRSRHA